MFSPPHMTTTYSQKNAGVFVWWGLWNQNNMHIPLPVFFSNSMDSISHLLLTHCYELQKQTNSTLFVNNTTKKQARLTKVIVTVLVQHSPQLTLCDPPIPNMSTLAAYLPVELQRRTEKLSAFLFSLLVFLEGPNYQIWTIYWSQNFIVKTAGATSVWIVVWPTTVSTCPRAKLERAKLDKEIPPAASESLFFACCHPASARHLCCCLTLWPDENNTFLDIDRSSCTEKMRQKHCICTYGCASIYVQMVCHQSSLSIFESSEAVPKCWNRKPLVWGLVLTDDKRWTRATGCSDGCSDGPMCCLFDVHVQH